MYRVLVTNGRTFQTFDKKDRAIDCAKNCFDLGFDDIYVGYGNGNPVPKTPRFIQTEERKFNPCWIHLFTTKPWMEVQKFKADMIRVIADTNGIEDEFYREFWLDGVLTGRYSSERFMFDFGEEIK